MVLIEISNTLIRNKTTLEHEYIRKDGWDVLSTTSSSVLHLQEGPCIFHQGKLSTHCQAGNQKRWGKGPHCQYRVNFWEVVVHFLVEGKMALK
jgi:hypothetical protein